MSPDCKSGLADAAMKRKGGFEVHNFRTSRSQSVVFVLSFSLLKPNQRFDVGHQFRGFPNITNPLMLD